MAGATGVAASTIFLIILPLPIYDIATEWRDYGESQFVLRRERQCCMTMKQPARSGGLLSIGAVGSATDVGIETGQAVGEAFGALSGHEPQEE